MATCPQCESENIQEVIAPPCVSYTCLDCGYEWVTCLDPRLMYLPLKTLIWISISYASMLFITV